MNFDFLSEVEPLQLDPLVLVPTPRLIDVKMGATAISGTTARKSTKEAAPTPVPGSVWSEAAEEGPRTVEQYRSRVAELDARAEFLKREATDLTNAWRFATEVAAAGSVVADAKAAVLTALRNVQLCERSLSRKSVIFFWQRRPMRARLSKLVEVRSMAERRLIEIERVANSLGRAVDTEELTELKTAAARRKFSAAIARGMAQKFRDDWGFFEDGRAREDMTEEQERVFRQFLLDQAKNAR